MNIIGKRLWFFLIAGILAVAAIISLSVLHVNYGVDFQPGSVMTVSFESTVDRDTLRTQLDTMAFESATIEPIKIQGSAYNIRTHELTQSQVDQFQSDLTAKFGKMSMSTTTEGATVTGESQRNAIIAVIVAIIGMLIYIAWAFRKMPNPFRYAVCAVIGLAFDLLMALGVYSILGKISTFQIDLMFVSGLLAILGFSINNTIIVFDRIRENMGKGISPDIETVANHSVVETLGRSFNSSLTALFTLFVLAIFVGSSIQNFVIVLIIGVISGVYSSTCLAPELLVAWQKKNWGNMAGKSTELSVAKAKS
jgi:preprotein translocase subunit SecF